ncbi:hypothetical protein [Granulicella tundricola]|uniref:Uncharacterized protein n=1 Tax=Granulicella tundricola (strain ATCC BAA-1859 / DSM 23138 / MP5ACTX9) TaxID=1198114 RepID=E8X3N3_GRATM|nr:hypothetical protein [Granulicella tundricola]ADW68224.1 hypothetical protein AciX9_1161 [Granulicella tundricola MP5ACTX9]
MADQLYLSLFFPNFRFDSLPATMVSVLRQFARISGIPRVSASAAYPVSFNEAPIYQRQFVLDQRAAESEDTSASIIENAVAEATELLHEDTAYEFEMKWNLWLPQPQGEIEGAELDILWKPIPTTVKFLGFGPDFDDSTFEQNGHIRVDFGLDTPWIIEDPEDEENDLPILSFEDEEAKAEAAKHIKQNIEMLLAFTLSVEKHCNISSRLLWTESGEPLAEKLIARLQRLT